MSLPVDTPEFWKERIERAKRDGREHYSVFLARKELWDAINKAHRKILERECAGYRVLDAGCGYGRAAEWFDPKLYHGVDFSPDFLAIAREQHPQHRFTMGTLDTLAFPDKHFDVAFCISMKQMIIGNMGPEAWAKMEAELLRVADRVLILEYEEDPEEYYIA